MTKFNTYNGWQQEQQMNMNNLQVHLPVVSCRTSPATIDYSLKKTISDDCREAERLVS